MRDRLTGFLRQAGNVLRGGKAKPPKPPKPSPPKPPQPSSVVVVDGVTIEYSPTPDGDPDPGEVVWAWVSYEEDPSQGKDRPVVVIGRRGGEYVGVPLTSKRDDRDPQVAVGTGPWDSQRRPSYARLDRVIDLDPRKVRREGSALGRAHFDDVIAGLRLLHAR